jgi:MFS family permease
MRNALPNATHAAWWQQTNLLVLVGGIIMGLSLGVRHVQGLFLLPITLEHGWSREIFGLAMAIQNLTWGVAQPVAGMLADRFGAVKVMAGGLLLYALGLVVMAHTTSPPVFIWVAGITVGMGLSGTSFGVVYGALSKLVAPAQRSGALGLAGAMGGFVQFAMVPAVQEMLSRWGWPGALSLLAALMVAVLPLAGPLRTPNPVENSSPSDMQMSAAIREAFQHPGFWLLNMGFLACGFQLAFVATHLPSYLLDQGMRPADAVVALAIVALTNVFGTYCFGTLGAVYRKKYLLSGIYLLRTGAMALFVMLPLSPWSLYVFAAVMGFVWLGTAPLTNGLVSQVFGVRYVSTLFGFVFFGHQLGGFLGVWLGSRLFEATQSYNAIWIIAMVLGVVAAALHAPLDDRELVRPGKPVAAT